MKVKDITEIVTSDLRALLWWATVGMRSAVGGSYENEVDDILESYAKAIGFKLPGKPKFRNAPRRRN